MKMHFKQAEYKYICHRADKGFGYTYADEEKSKETNNYWVLFDYKKRLIATVMKDTGKVHEGYDPTINKCIYCDEIFSKKVSSWWHVEQSLLCVSCVKKYKEAKEQYFETIS
jgi:hypothetical protein